MKNIDRTLLDEAEQEISNLLHDHQIGLSLLPPADLIKIHTALSKERVTERHAKMVIASGYEDIMETVEKQEDREIILTWLKGFKNRFLTELLALYK